MPKLNSEKVVATGKASPYARHLAKWKDCQRCSLASQRRRVVFARGVVPADVLFVGEAPGMSENASGEPFDGPAGDLLNRIVREAFDLDVDAVGGQYPFHRVEGDDRPVPRIAFYNVVSCFPREAKLDGSHAPPPDACRACSPKIKEFIDICRPRVIICVGAIAERYIHLSADVAGDNLVVDSIMHPANILSRLPLAQKDFEVRKSVTRIRKAAERAGLG